jgi:hypothetical protein
MRRSGWFALLVAGPLYAHVMSMSTGDATVNGSHLDYVLRMPLYEIPKLAHPETELMKQIRFAGARPLHQKCFVDRDSYVCVADYDFAARIERLDVACTLYKVVAANHVHLLRAEIGAKHDQAIFDYTFTSATLRFRPPTATEIALAQAGAGGMRSVGGVAQALFLLSLALAARTKRELLAITGAFLIGLTTGALVNWRPAPKFVEAAAALSIAYLAVEILFLPTGGMRWLIAGALGVFQGLYLALFVDTSGYRPEYVLAGAAIAGTTVTLLFGAVMFQIRKPMPRLADRVPAAALLVTGLAWFFLRLRG